MSWKIPFAVISQSSEHVQEHPEHDQERHQDGGECRPTQPRTFGRGHANSSGLSRARTRYTSRPSETTAPTTYRNGMAVPYTRSHSFTRSQVSAKNPTARPT